MNVWLDPKAPDAESEYAIRHDPDYFGKIVFKSFCRAFIGIPDDDLEIPLPKANQEIRGFIGDARVRLRTPRLQGDMAIEIKLSHLHHHKTAGDNWAFTNIFRTAKGNPKSRFDLLFCIGLPTRNPSDEDYWDHHKSLGQILDARQLKAVKAKPYESNFLSVCSFFILPFDKIPRPRGERTNNFQPYKINFRDKPGYEFFAPGLNRYLCRKVWHEAAEISMFAKRSSQSSSALNLAYKD